MRRYRRGTVAAVLAGAYAILVLVLGVVSLVILLTVQDPILLTGVALAAVTFPLGWLIWWGWDFLPPGTADPVLLIVALTVAGLLQSWLIWRMIRGPSLHTGGTA
ncbi:SCO4225 family membrane protein [Nonomuraea sp. NPDC049480]|uniref:SCO4225 family membrane protein n=1 Tax=Nonomuraea sp. NPDC049480 TaxID=3364353 RepID=UPI0037AA0F68